MSHKQTVLDQLVDLSHWLGDESRGLAILGEGNTSARIDEESFFVKASGAQLGNLTGEGLVEVAFSPVLEALESGADLSDADVKSLLSRARVDPDARLLPSIETLFHACLLSLPGVCFVGHTHPISVNSILCSRDWRDVVSGRVFPDEIVCCGAAPAVLEYTDPGVPLAKKVKHTVERHIGEYGERPKAILMQNHGLIAMGDTMKEVQSISAMWDKTAKVLAGTMHFGGPNYLTEASVNRIANRPDEHQRKKMIEGR